MAIYFTKDKYTKQEDDWPINKLTKYSFSSPAKHLLLHKMAIYGHENVLK